MNYYKNNRNNNINNNHNNTLSRKKPIENVLVLQGGGSLGAFACGVFKAWYKKNIKFGIVSGTSIGAINGAIIAGSKSDNPVQDLEDFWIKVESSYNIIPDIVTFDYDDKTKQTKLKTVPSASLNAALFGVPKMFIPRWFQINNFMTGNFYFGQQQLPWKWTYIYDNSPLIKTLEKIYKFSKLSPEINSPPTSRSSSSSSTTTTTAIRLIVTAVNALIADPLLFDSFKMQIQLKHLLASVGYPNYGFSWVEVDDGVYGWDGSLLSNTPMREVILQSPSHDKNIFIVENHAKIIKELPSDMTEVQPELKIYYLVIKLEVLDKFQN